MRVAALSGASDRAETKDVVERAISLEREIWSGEPAQSAGSAGPSEIASRVEGLLRAILRRGVTGELGNDFRAAADEALLAEGLAFGEGSPTEMGGATEWDLEPEPVAVTEPDPPTLEQVIVAEEESIVEEPEDFEIPDADQIVVSRAQAPEPEPTVARTGPDTSAVEETLPFSFVEDDGTVVEAPEEEPEPAGWLDEVDGGETMNFPARSKHLDDLARPPLDREEVKARVEYLFPRTETNWNVGSRAPHRAAG